MNRRLKGIGHPPPAPPGATPPVVPRGTTVELPPVAHEPAMAAPYRPDLDARPLVVTPEAGVPYYAPAPYDPPVPTVAALNAARAEQRARGQEPPKPSDVVRQRLDAICAHLERGIPMRYATLHEGVTPAALRALAERDSEVQERIARADARGFVRWFGLLEIAGEDGNAAGAKVATTVLERRYPEGFRPATQAIEQTTVPATPAQLRRALDAAEQANALEAELARREAALRAGELMRAGESDVGADGGMGGGEVGGAGVEMPRVIDATASVDVVTSEGGGR